jgi:CBS domain-containing protein
MRSDTIVLASHDSVGAALARVERMDGGPYPVRVRSGVWASISGAELKRLAEEGHTEQPLADVLELADTLPSLYPDLPLEAALQLIGHRALLPVVHRADPGRLEGVVTLDDLLAVYRKASEVTRGPERTI